LFLHANRVSSGGNSVALPYIAMIAVAISGGASPGSLLLQKTASDNLQAATAEAKIRLPAQRHSSAEGKRWQRHCSSMATCDSNLLGGAFGFLAQWYRCSSPSGRESRPSAPCCQKNGKQQAAINWQQPQHRSSLTATVSRQHRVSCCAVSNSIPESNNHWWQTVMATAVTAQ